MRTLSIRLCTVTLLFGLGLLGTGCRSKQSEGTDKGQDQKGTPTEANSSTSDSTTSPNGDGGESTKSSEKDTPGATEKNETPKDTPEEKTPSPEASPEQPQPLGAQCRKDSHCESGHCAEVFIESGGGIVRVLRCSECKTNEDCPKSGSRCVNSGSKQARVCSMGELGRQCEDDNDCADPTLCAKLLTGENQFETTFCSECRSNEDCKDPTAPNCLTLFGGEELFNSCEPDGVRKNGQPCFPCDTGDLECEGYCVKADVPNDDEFCIGVCGSCRDDADCAEGERCTPPEFNFKEGGGFGEHVASKCVQKGLGSKNP